MGPTSNKGRAFFTLFAFAYANRTYFAYANRSATIVPDNVGHAIDRDFLEFYDRDPPMPSVFVAAYSFFSKLLDCRKTDFPIARRLVLVSGRERFSESGKMARVFVKELKDGDSVNEIYLLADKQLRANRNANLYLLATLRDRTGVVSGLMWNVVEENVQHISAGEYVRVRGKVQLYQGGLQMIVTHIDPVPETTCNPEDFNVQAQANAAPLLARLKELLFSVKSTELLTLASAFMEDEALVTGLCSAPAGVKAHHAYMGGLIEHVVGMSEVADRICTLYPALNRDLLMLGVLLHDIGKVKELSWDPTLAYTDEGQLLGHINIAIEMLNEKLKVVEVRLGRPVEAEDILRLKHMILSHHGTREFGSPTIPMTPEAITLHHIDNLDAKLNEFTRAIEDDLNAESAWTPFNPRTDRRLFKGLPKQA